MKFASTLYRTAITIGALVIAPLGLIACGDDSNVADSGPATDSNVRDAFTPDGASTDCNGVANGTVCGEQQICLDDLCLNSRCGDGYIDEAAGETCEDRNEISGDGCEPASCTFSCTVGDDLCSDDDPCNGTESCDESTHRCVAGDSPAEETACIQEDESVGICSGGLCAALGCGNGTREGDEICDDGNEDSSDGCKPDCTYTCEKDSECSDGDACNGEETCDLTTHSCVMGEALSCEDEDICTADSCEAEVGCVFTLIDDDGDGFAEADACSTPGLSGGDCNDNNDGVFPGAPELCDTINNDCDGDTDEDIVEVECRADADGDGYGDEAAVMSACMCPAGTVPPRRDGDVDCDDGDSNVHEGQTAYFSRAHCSGRACGDNDPYDYDCDGRETQQYPDEAEDCHLVFIAGGGTRCEGTGWLSGSAPRCGGIGRLQICGRTRTSFCDVVSVTAPFHPCR